MFFAPRETSLQGTKLLDAEGLNVLELIEGFVDLRIVKKANHFPWAERKNPFGDD